MTAHRWSQERLAKELDVSQGLVSSWSRGKGLPGLPHALKLARIFGVSLDYLADDALDDPGATTSTPAGVDLRPDEWYIVRAARAFGLAYEEAVRRLSGVPGGAAILRTVKDVERTEEMRRDEERRSGTQPKPDRKAPEGDHVPPVREK